MPTLYSFARAGAEMMASVAGLHNMTLGEVREGLCSLPAQRNQAKSLEARTALVLANDYGIVC